MYKTTKVKITLTKLIYIYIDICGTLVHKFRNKTTLNSQVCLYNTLALPVMQHRSVKYTFTKVREQSRFTTRIKGFMKADRLWNTSLQTWIYFEAIIRDKITGKNTWPKWVWTAYQEYCNDINLRTETLVKQNTLNDLNQLKNTTMKRMTG